MLERFASGRSFYAAVFDQLPAGAYTLWHEGTPLVRGAAIAAAAIAELDLTGDLPAAGRARAA